MSNCLSVRRVMVQTLNEDGTPDGKPTYGVMAADGYEQVYNDTFGTFDELNTTIEKAGSILGIVSGNGAFSDVNTDEIGTDNFCGNVDTWEGQELDSIELADQQEQIRKFSPFDSTM